MTMIDDDPGPLPGHLLVGCPVPETLEQAFGYQGEGRYFFAHWTMAGDEAEVYDGISGGTGEWDGFLAYVRHPFVRKGLTVAGFDPYADTPLLGSSESEATHALFFDRRARTVALAPLRDAARFAASQWPQSENPQLLTVEDASRLVTLIDQRLQESAEAVTFEQIKARVRDHAAAVETMVAALDHAARGLRHGGN